MGTQSYTYNDQAQWATKFSFQLQGTVKLSSTQPSTRFYFNGTTSPTPIETISITKPATGDLVPVTKSYSGYVMCSSTSPQVASTCTITFNLWRGRTPVVGSFRATISGAGASLACIQNNVSPQYELQIWYNDTFTLQKVCGTSTLKTLSGKFAVKTNVGGMGEVVALLEPNADVKLTVYGSSPSSTTTTDYVSNGATDNPTIIFEPNNPSGIKLNYFPDKLGPCGNTGGSSVLYLVPL